MIAIDTNLLVYAHRRDSEFHQEAAKTVKELAEGKAPWAIPWPCVHEFFSTVTHPRIYDPPSTTHEAIGQVDAWFNSPTLVLLSEAHDHWVALGELLIKGHVKGPLVHDARIAAICISNGVSELWTLDRDFGRFPTLRTKNPLR